MGLSPSILTSLPDTLTSHILGYLAPGYEWYFHWKRENITEGSQEALASLIFQGTLGMVREITEAFPQLSTSQFLALSVLTAQTPIEQYFLSKNITLTPWERQAFSEDARFYALQLPHGALLAQLTRQAFLVAIKQGYFEVVKLFYRFRWGLSPAARLRGFRTSVIHQRITIMEFLYQLRKPLKIHRSLTQYWAEGSAYINYTEFFRTTHLKLQENLDYYSVCCWAARGGHRELLLKLAAEHSFPPSDFTLYAAYSGKLEFFLELLGQDQDPDYDNLYHGILEFYTKHPRRLPRETIQGLLLLIPEDRLGTLHVWFERLMVEHDYPMMEFLVHQGVNVNDQWHYPVEQQDEDLIRWYLAHGGSPGQGLFEAVKQRRPNLMRLFIAAGAHNFEESLACTLLEPGIYEEGVLILLEQRIQSYRRFLVDIISGDNFPALSFLVRQGFRGYELGLKIAAQRRSPWWMGFFSDLGARNHTSALSSILHQKFRTEIAWLLNMGADLEKAIDMLCVETIDRRYPFLEVLRTLRTKGVLMEWLQGKLSEEMFQGFFVTPEEVETFNRYAGYLL